jgi:clan AA aspartic protease (TIGR02281 family)
VNKDTNHFALKGALTTAPAVPCNFLPSFKFIGALLLTALLALGQGNYQALAAPAGGAGKASSAPQAAPAADKRTQAIALYNAKDFRGAAALLDEYLANNSRDAYGAYYAALAYQQLGNSRKATVYYRQVYTLQPSSQVGGYAKNILLKLDPSFAASIAASASPSADNSAPPTSISDLPAEDEKLDPSLPPECRVRFEKGLGHVELDVYLDSRPVKMMLDTGAPGICIGKNQLSAMGAPLPTGNPVGYTGGASNGTAVAFWIVKATVKVGPLERKNIPITVLENNAASPLLGQTFFKGFDYTIDQGGGEVIFRQKALSAKLGTIRNSVSVPFTFREAGNRIIVQVEVEGKSGPMIFDTGNTSNACVFRSFAEAKNFGLTIPDDAVRARHIGVSGTGSALHFPVKRIKLGPIDRSDIEVAVNEGMEDRENLPLLGQPFWAGYEYTIDMKKKLIHFVRR